METPGLLARIYLTVLSYVLCVLSNFAVAITLFVFFIFRGSTKFWRVKERKLPKCLENPEYGDHKYMKVNNIKLHYVESGDPKKSLMLFLHGFPDFWYTWRYQIKEFKKNYRTIALDLPGYGDSDKLLNVSDYHIDKLVEYVEKFIKNLGSQKVILIGHDWGAMIGFRFVCKHMDMIDKYVMMGACSGEVWMKLMTSTFEQLKMSWYVFMLQMPFVPEFLLNCWDFALFNDRISKNVTEEHIEALKFTFSKKNSFKGPVNYYRANSNYLFPGAQVKRPVKFAKGIFLLGENEKYISKRSGELMMSDYENLDFRIVKNAKHFIHTDVPEMVNSIIRELLE